MQIGEARLHGEEQDREDVLQHQYAERDAAGQRIELALLVQHLDDDDRAGQRTGNAQIYRVETARPHRQPDPPEEQDPEQAAADQLPAGSEQDDLAGAHDLFQVDFQPDHEQHEYQAELGDDVNRILGMDPFHAEWTNHKPGDKVGEDQRLPGKMGQQAKHPGKQDA